MKTIERDFAARAFSMCSSEQEEDQMETLLKELISKVNQMGELQQHDWDNELLPK